MSKLTVSFGIAISEVSQVTLSRGICKWSLLTVARPSLYKPIFKIQTVAKYLILEGENPKGAAPPVPAVVRRASGQMASPWWECWENDGKVRQEARDRVGIRPTHSQKLTPTGAHRVP